MKTKKFNYRIKPSFAIIPHSDSHVELRKGVWNPISYHLTDKSDKSQLTQLVLALDGKKSLAEITKYFKIRRSEIEGLLEQLNSFDALESQPENMIDYFIEETQPPFPNINSNANTKPSILFMGDKMISDALIQQVGTYISNAQCEWMSDDSELYTKLFTLAHQDIHDEIDFHWLCDAFAKYQNTLIVFTLQVIHPLLLLRFNQIAYETNLRWFHAALDGPMLYVGPLFFPKTGPCYHCFEKRVSMNIVQSHSYVKYKQALAHNKLMPTRYIAPVFSNLLASHLSLEIINYLFTENSYLTNRVLSLYLPTREIGYNELLRLPHCPVCGSVKERDASMTYFDKQMIMESTS